MLNPIFIYDELFENNFYVSVGVSREELKEQIISHTKQDNLNWDEVLPSERTSGRTIMVEPNSSLGKELKVFVWIWIEDDKRLDILAHEIFHAVSFALRVRGVEFCEATDELFAYYIGFLTKKIYKQLKVI